MTHRARVTALVDGPSTRRAVRRALAEQVPAGTPIGPLRLGRVTWKPNGRLRGFFTVSVGGRPRMAAVRWESIEPAAPRTIELWPADSQWPHVADALAGPTYRSALHAAGWDGAGAVEVDIVRYRPGQRHVVRLTGADATQVYLKVGPADSGGRSAARATALARAGEEVGMLAAAPVWCSDPLGAVAVRTVPGLPFVPGPRPDAVELAHVARLGAALAALHRRAVPAVGLDRSEPAEARRLTRRACEHVVALHPELAPAIDRALGEAVRLIGSAAPPMLLHGDAKVDHFLVSGPDLGMIDLDSVRLGDPAEDLGRMLASIWWGTEADSRGAVRDAVLDGYGREAVATDRLAGWTMLATIRQAARRVPVLDPTLGDRLLDQVTAVWPP